MKLNIKLSSDEALGFKNFMEYIYPDKKQRPQLDEFAKIIFFNGIEYLNMKLTETAKNMVNDPELRKKLEDQGVDLTHIEEHFNKKEGS